MIQINYVRYRTFTLSLRILSGAGTLFIRLKGCVRSQLNPSKAATNAAATNCRVWTSYFSSGCSASEGDGRWYRGMDIRLQL